MNKKQKINIFWFRRDLRLEANTGLHHALQSEIPVLPIFIFDVDIIQELPPDDPRISFIYDSLKKIHLSLQKSDSSLYVAHGKPIDVWDGLLSEFSIQNVFANKDYEPYAIKRDKEIEILLNRKQITFHSFKDQVVFEEHDVLKPDGKPYTVFTPYKKKWLAKFTSKDLMTRPSATHLSNTLTIDKPFPSLKSFGFIPSTIQVKSYDLNNLDNYDQRRNIPSIVGTSHLSPHLRFGTVSVRQVIKKTLKHDVFVSELIWREFFMQILFHFPHVVDQNFKSKYDQIKWRNDGDEFKKWCDGNTGYPMVDAGMRELNQTGYMHNRVRMITAGFLCKHLLIDWKWGEAYFAQKLLDYDLSANNGNWQWSAGTGCDSAPYFRIFNPTEQVKKFDKELVYIKKWVPEIGSLNYPAPMVDHKFARQRALETYKIGLKKST